MKRSIMISFVIISLILIANIIGMNLNNISGVKISPELNAERRGTWVYFWSPADCFLCISSSDPGCPISALPPDAWICPV